MTKPAPHGQVPDTLIDLIDAYAETRHRCGGIYNARTEAARKAVIEALSGVQALSAAPVVPHMSAAEVNNLPAHVRAYIHQLATLCDPAGLVRENVQLLDTNNALQKMYRRAADACAEVFGCFATAEIEGLKDALSDTTDDRLKDLVERRLMYAMHAVRDIAASPTPPVEQAAPKAAPEVGNSGFDHKTAADLLNGKTVSDEAVRKFVAASRWAHDERAALSATLLAMHGVLTSREAEIALLKKALLEAEAAPQQEPVAWLNPWRADQVTTDYDAYGERGIPLYTSPNPAPAPLSDDSAKDAARYRWLRINAIGAFRTNDGKGPVSVYHLSKIPAIPGIPEETDAAIDAALAAQGVKA